MKTSFSLLISLFVMTGGAPQAPSNSESALRIRKIVAPPFDDRLYYARAQGKVRIRATVLPSGQVEDAVVQESFWTWNDTMNEYFLTFARKWLFEPSDTSQTIDIVLDFKLLPEEGSDYELGTVFVAPATIEIRRKEPPPVSFHRGAGGAVRHQ